jgi:hyperosmotically inducible protein
MKRQFFILSSICLLLTACEQNRTDNTARNARDRGATVTPGDQSENDADRSITQKVRQAIMEDDSLSTNAKNVKIMTTNGVVTLRGIVNSEREKNVIGQKAKAVSGVRNVDNQLEIARDLGRGANGNEYGQSNNR